MKIAATPWEIPVLNVSALSCKQRLDDFTLLIDREQLEILLSAGNQKSPFYLALKKLYDDGTSYLGPLVVCCDAKTLLPEGRALICPSYGGACFSATVRISSSELRKLGAAPKPAKPTNAQTAWDDEIAGETCPAEHREFLASPRFLTDLVYARVWQRPQDWSKSGVFVIAGETGCGKTTFLRSLIVSIIREKRNAGQSKRPPHLVTFEDPVELPYMIPEKTLSSSGFDYTPRQPLGQQALTLNSALRDALRQTPALVMVGEVRDKRSWRAVMDFAGTGHVIIVTTHAASITECISKMFDACDVDTAMKRAALAARIMAVVHLRPTEVERETALSIDGKNLTHYKLVVPALWTNTPQAVSELVSDGLASLLPQNSRDSSVGSIGRQFFLSEILSKSHKDMKIEKSQQAQLRARVLTWDLEGK